MPSLSLSLNCPPTAYTISWSSDIAVGQGGYLNIDKNSVNQVYVTNTTTGSFTANSGDTISISVSGTTYSNFAVYGLIYVDSTLEASGSATFSVTVTHSFTVSGDHYISGVVYDEF